MRVLVAGATGVVGRQLVPLLHSVGHEPVALVRSPERAAALEGTRSVVADALDREAVLAAVKQARPDAVVHLLTAIPAELNPRRIARDFAQTNRLRTEATRSLIDGAWQVGAQRFIGQSVAFAYAPGSGPADEAAPLLDPPRSFAPVLDAVVELERLTTEVAGLVLRFGHLYGPGTAFGEGGSLLRQVDAGKLPVVGSGRSTFSFLHTHDAATSIVAALDRDVSGVVNVVDDEPVMFSQWLRELAAQRHAPAPRSVPAWLARLAVGSWGVTYLTGLRGADNAKARLALDWKPRYASWRDGFGTELG